MDSYSTFIFESVPEISRVPEAHIESFHWEKENYSRPETYVRFLAVRDLGFYAFLRSFETPVLSRYTNRDDPVYTDSCLEVFISPVNGRTEYINFEINPNGAFLSQFGSERNNRVFIKELTDIAPAVQAQIDPENESWQAGLFVPEKLISELYGIDYHVSSGEIRGNFYKCADDSPSPHYGALFPVGSEALGFHNPTAFGRIIIDDER